MLQKWLSYCSYMESPPIVQTWVGLFLMSCALKRNVWLEWDRPLYPNFYLLIVAPAGMRKTSSMLDAKELIIRPTGLIRLAPTAVIREEFLHEMAGKDKPKNMLELIKPCAHMAIAATEAATILNKDNLKFLEDLLELFDCNPLFDYKTRNSGEAVMENPFLTILAATTPNQIGKVLPEQAAGSGLLSRFIAIYYEKLHKQVVFPGDLKKDAKALDEIIKYVLLASQVEGEIILSDGFRKIYEPWYLKQDNELGQQQRKKLIHYIPRRPTHLLKVAMISSVFRHIDHGKKLELQKDDFEFAYNLLRQTEKNMHKSYAAVGLSRESELKYSVATYIKESKKVDFISLFRAFRTDTNKKELMSVIIDLQATGDIRTEEKEANFDIIWTG